MCRAQAKQHSAEGSRLRESAECASGSNRCSVAASPLLKPADYPRVLGYKKGSPDGLPLRIPGNGFTHFAASVCDTDVMLLLIQTDKDLGNLHRDEREKRKPDTDEPFRPTDVYQIEQTHQRRHEHRERDDRRRR